MKSGTIVVVTKAKTRKVPRKRSRKEEDRLIRDNVTAPERLLRPTTASSNQTAARRKQFAQAHHKSLHALANRDFKALDVAINRERDLIEEQKTVIDEQKAMIEHASRRNRRKK